MNGLILLLYCIEILVAQLCGAKHETGSTISSLGNGNGQDHSEKSLLFNSKATSVTDITSATSEARTLMNAESPTAVSQISNSRSTSPSPGPQLATTTTTTTTTTLYSMFFRKECLPVFMLTGGLIIACVILLVSALLLVWKVCQLSRRIKALSSNADLISNSEYWLGTAKKNKSKSETEAKETSMLMAVVSQTQEETGNGTSKEEGGEVNKDGQMGEENKKEVGDTANSDEASSTPVTVTKKSSSSKPQEEATDSMAASSSEGTEEPKDVV